MFINKSALVEACRNFKGNAPFDHSIVDNFFETEVVKNLELEFPSFDSDVWHEYLNPIEIKRTCNNWNVFPPLTYRVMEYLNSVEFCGILSNALEIEKLTADQGLNGGGWHAHKSGGKLNTHLDYNIHPKLGRQRKLNIIVYLNSEWRPEWGGQLGLWAQDEKIRRPGKLVKSVDPNFNRAVLFDTTQDSWHGLPDPLTCPEGQIRKSIAVYYLVPAAVGEDGRGKALFAPTAGQENDSDVLDLIRRRSDVNSASDTYRNR